jgi:uncharacterized membrane protein
VTAQTISRLLLAAFFLLAGLYHFLSPGLYLQMMPPYLPWPVGLIAISGVAEIAGGMGVLFPPVRAAAAWGLILLLIAVFPANIQAAISGMSLGGKPVAHWILLMRLPVQFLFIYWVYWSCLIKR